jgi:hypothetical protein
MGEDGDTQRVRITSERAREQLERAIRSATS